MHTQMAKLEEERLRALEAAARARTEVADLTESRRKLQWQSKLLEKMSEVCCTACVGWCVVGQWAGGSVVRNKAPGTPPSPPPPS